MMAAFITYLVLERVSRFIKSGQNWVQLGDKNLCIMMN